MRVTSSIPTMICLGAAAMIAACSAADGPPPTGPASSAEPTALVSVPTASASSSSAVAAEGPIKISAWTEKSAIEGLARDCRWDPNGCIAKLEQASKVGNGWETPPGCEAVNLACDRVPEQTCVPDRCSHSDDDCWPECNTACHGCGDACATKCESCKASCHDDACRYACAEKCGDCHQACVTELDHCTTGHCGEVQEQCFKDWDGRWNKSSCPTVCPLVSACVEKCPQADNQTIYQQYNSPCANACAKKHMKGCPAEFDAICKGDPNDSINFNLYHERHNPPPPSPHTPSPAKGH